MHPVFVSPDAADGLPAPKDIVIVFPIESGPSIKVWVLQHEPLPIRKATSSIYGRAKIVGLRSWRPTAMN
jgi:hypothetical protein